MKIRRYLLAGTGVILPFFITTYIGIMLLRMADNLAGKHINSYLWQNFGFRIPGLGLLILFLFILTVGLVSTRVIGRKLVPLLERSLMKLPFVAGVYPAAKQLSKFFFDAGAGGKYKKAVLVQYPTDTSYAVGFITNDNVGILSPRSEDDLVSVFVPLAPTPFSGILLLLPPEKIKVLDVSVDQALKFIISGGIISPYSTFTV